MAIDRILITTRRGGRQAALMERGVLRRLAVAPPGDGLRVGDVVLGRIARIVRGIDAAFVDVGEARPGFLGLAAAATDRRLAEGDAVVVRVVREADAGKGAKLARAEDAAIPAVAGTRPPAVLSRSPDAAISAVVEEAGEACRRIVVDDAAVRADVRAAAPALAERVEMHLRPSDLFALDGLDDPIAEALAPTVALPSGGTVAFAETAAVVAIDVDTARADAGGRGATALAVDLEAAEAIADGLRLRELAGHVVVDFVPVRGREARARLVATFRRALARDPRPTHVAGFTRLGLVELTRERRGPSLARALAMASAHPAPRAVGDG